MKKLKTIAFAVTINVVVGLCSVTSFQAASENAPAQGGFSITNGSECFLVAHRASQMDKRTVNGVEEYYSKFEAPEIDTWDYKTESIRGYQFTNTKESIKYAYDNGADVIEIDVRALFDNTGNSIGVVYHDVKFDISGNGTLRLGQTNSDTLGNPDYYTFNDLQSFYSSTSRHEKSYELLTLNSLFYYISQNFPEKYIYIDLRDQINSELKAEIAEKLALYGLEERCIVRIEPKLWNDEDREDYLSSAIDYLHEQKVEGALNNINVLTSIEAWEVYNELTDPPTMTPGDVNGFISYLRNDASEMVGNMDAIIVDGTSYNTCMNSTFPTRIHNINGSTGNPLLIYTSAGNGVVATSTSGADIITAVDRICDKANAFLYNSATYDHADVVNWVKTNNIFNFTNEYFNPQKPTSKTKAVLMLWKMAGKPAASGVMPFSDVSYDPTSDKYKAILWAANQGYITGTTFSPESNMKRSTYMIILYRYCGSQTVSGNVTDYYPDCANCSPGAKKAILWGHDNNIITDCSGVFNPNGDAVRIAVSTFLKNCP